MVTNPVFLLAGLASALAVVLCLGVAGRVQPRVGPLARWLAVVPAVLALALFYSLAVHLHGTLGGWPETLGERGFPRRLSLHASAAQGAFAGVLLSVFVLVPLAALICWLVRPWRRWMGPVGVHGAACLLCLVAIELAPQPFLSWWWD